MKSILKIILYGVVICFLSPMPGMATPTSYDIVGKVWDNNFSSFVWGNMTLADINLSPHPIYPVESFSIYSNSFVFSGNQGGVDPTGWTSWGLNGTMVAGGKTIPNSIWSGSPVFFYGDWEGAVYPGGFPLDLGWLLNDPNRKPALLDFASLRGTPLSGSSDLHGYLYATNMGDAVSAPEASSLLYILSGLLMYVPVLRRTMYV